MDSNTNRTISFLEGCEITRDVVNRLLDAGFKTVAKIADTENRELLKVTGLTEDIVNKLKDYLLKWKDYPKEENSWVRKEDLDCPDLLADFEREIKTKRMPNNGRVQPVPSSSTSTSAAAATATGAGAAAATATGAGAAAGTVAANQVQTNSNQVVTTQGLNINLNQPHNERDQTDNGDRNENINVIGVQKINDSFSYNVKKKISSTLTVVYMLSSEDATQKYPQEIVKFWETLGEKILTTRTTTTP